MLAIPAGRTWWQPLPVSVLMSSGTLRFRQIPSIVLGGLALSGADRRLFVKRSLSQARWTHVALPVSNLDRSVEFFTSMTPLVVVARFEDERARGAWLSNDKQVQDPFVLVLSEFAPRLAQLFGMTPGEPHATLAPFAHIGIELPTKDDVDAIAARARALGALYREPAQMPDPIGYICSLKDPDGNVVEFSWNQLVYDTVQQLWGD
jgi:catechol 2,3-dioxygenase-like lactoylglutathione lyase family enzyme